VLQVIDAKEDNRDCQPEHLSRKLTGNPAKQLSHCAIGSLSDFASSANAVGARCFSMTQSRNDSTTQFFLREFHAEERPLDSQDVPGTRHINPFSEKQVREGVISYGLSSYGYDLRVADEFKIFTNVNSSIVDPKHFDERSFVTIQTDVCIVPPNSFALARSVEYFKIPRSVLTICVGKSTYARCGIIVNVTPFEPEWEGFVTLEISNTTPLPARIYANEGLCQIIFFESDEICETSYADRKGKYQAQKGIVLPKL